MVTVVLECWKDDREGPVVGKYSSRFGVLTATTSPKSHNRGRKQKEWMFVHFIMCKRMNLVKGGLIDSNNRNTFVVFQ